MKVEVRGTVSIDLVREAKELSKSRGVSFSSLLERAIDSYIRELHSREKFIRKSKKPARR